MWNIEIDKNFDEFTKRIKGRIKILKLMKIFILIKLADEIKY